MNLGDIVGQLMREGLSPQTQNRIEHAVGADGLGAPGNSPYLGALLGGLLGGQADSASGAQSTDAQSQGGLGDILGGLGQMLGQDSGVGGLSKGQLGGLGALAGAILGGGGGATKGAIGGSAMALLGTLALSALKNWQAQQGAGA
jgi:hypothetical protein